MITNLLASIVVSLVTNTTETFPKHMVPVPPPAGQEMYLVYRAREEIDENPKEKWVTTNILEVTVIRFNALGKQYEAKSERAITNWTTHLLIAAPEPAKWTNDPTNAPIPWSWLGR
jgi:hypothetical protein